MDCRVALVPRVPRNDAIAVGWAYLPNKNCLNNPSPEFLNSHTFIKKFSLSLKGREKQSFIKLTSKAVG